MLYRVAKNYREYRRLRRLRNQPLSIAPQTYPAYVINLERSRVIEAIERYAQATRADACDGCGHVCGAALGGRVDVASTLRCVMYHDVYGDADKARRVFSQLSASTRALDGDFAAASRACPHGVDIARHMERARQILV